MSIHICVDSKNSVPPFFTSLSPETQENLRRKCLKKSFKSNKLTQFLQLFEIVKAILRDRGGGCSWLKRSPRKRNVECSHPRRDRPNSLIQVVTNQLLYARK